MACAVLLCGVATAIASQAQTLTVLASFNVKGTAFPGPLVQAADGNFYGMTEQGGANDSGSVFKITPGGTLTPLYSFGATLADGSSPEGGLIQATDGNFYGTTRLGGVHNHGTIFSITPAGTKTTLYNFGGASTDGNLPVAGLIQATDGDFYGTTLAGGAGGASVSGTVFKITPGGALTTLHAFGSTAGDGIAPIAGLLQATDGNFYGTTDQGGVYDEGTVFKMTPAGTLTTLYSFHPTNTFAYPSGLIQAANGNIYGTIANNAAGGPGAVFEVTLAGTLTMLYTFGATATDGVGPEGGLIQAADGNFYGTTSGGGTHGGGTIFKITPAGTETTLYSFGAAGTDAQAPSAALIQAADGNFYGTTSSGGAQEDGTVFRFTPAPSTSPTAPAIAASGGVVSGASFQPGIVPGSVITIFGTNLSTVTDNWSNSIVNGKLPTSLDGVTVMVGDQPAYLSYIGATQINAVAPDVAPGATTVTVTNSNGASPAVMATVAAAQPAFFQWGSYAVATRQDFSLAVKNGTFSGVTTVPPKPGDVIILWGTGFGTTSPAAPVGVETPSSTLYNTATAVTVKVGQSTATVYGAALAPGYAGLYQVAIQIPALADGDYPVVATINGVSSPSTTMITVQK